MDMDLEKLAKFVSPVGKLAAHQGTFTFLVQHPSFERVKNKMILTRLG